MSKKKLIITGTIFVLLIALAISGCTGSQTVKSTPTPTAAPSATPTPAPTLVPSGGPGADNTPTATPTPAPTTAITPTPTTAPKYSWPGYDFSWSTTPTPVPEGAVLLTINGSVNNPLELTRADLLAYPQYPATMWMQDETEVSGTGPLLVDLMESADPIILQYYGMAVYHQGGVSYIWFSDIYGEPGPSSPGEPEYTFVLTVGSDNVLEIVPDGYVGSVYRMTGVTGISVEELPN